jgi:hypothetical protein
MAVSIGASQHGESEALLERGAGGVLKAQICGAAVEAKSLIVDEYDMFGRQRKRQGKVECHWDTIGSAGLIC